jgi:hypothetical protein
MAFRSVLSALSFLVSRFDSIGGLVAETGRISTLVNQLDRESSASAAAASAVDTSQGGSSVLSHQSGMGGSYGGSKMIVRQEVSPGGTWVHAGPTDESASSRCKHDCPPLELSNLTIWPPGASAGGCRNTY